MEERLKQMQENRESLWKDIYSSDLATFIYEIDEQPLGSIDDDYHPTDEPDAYKDLLYDVIFTKLPKGNYYDKYTSTVSVKKPDESFRKRLRDSKLLVIGAEYSKTEQERWSLFDKNYIGIGRGYEDSDIKNPLFESNWDDEGYWEAVETLLSGKKYMNIVFDYGVTHHLHSSPESMKSLVNFLSKVLDPEGSLFCMPVYMRMYIYLYDIIEDRLKNRFIHSQILFLRELYKKFSRIDQGYLHVGTNYILYDRWMLD